MGPLEFLVIGFEGNRFNGEIMPELEALRRRQLIRVLDLVFVHKDDNGTVSSFELSDLPADEAARLTVLEDGAKDWFALDDIEQIAASLSNETAVALLLIEHRWALPLDTAIQRANGTLLAEGLVPRDLVAEVEELVGA
jgi:hypothetical protein